MNSGQDLSPTPVQLPTELALLSLYPSSDTEEEEDSPPPVPSSKQERIERAIELGRRTFHVRSQAETPFGWYASAERLASRSPLPRQAARAHENLIQGLYYRHEFRRALDECQQLFADPKFDNRDIIDLSLRACLKLGDVETGEKIARSCRSKWLSSPFLGVASGEVLFLGKHYSDALKAFLCALSGRTGLQVPFLEPTRRTQRPVYTIPSDHCWMTPPEVESVGQALALDLRSIGRLHSIHLKMVSHDDTGGTDPADEMSGVRNL